MSTMRAGDAEGGNGKGLTHLTQPGTQPWAGGLVFLKARTKRSVGVCPRKTMTHLCMRVLQIGKPYLAWRTRVRLMFLSVWQLWALVEPSLSFSLALTDFQASPPNQCMVTEYNVFQCTRLQGRKLTHSSLRSYPLP